MIQYPDIRSLKFNMIDDHGSSNSFKLDIAPEGDVYWFLGDSGYYISFHKSGETHMKNNFDKKFYERIDFDLFPNESIDWAANYFQNNVTVPEGREVYAWPIPIEQLNTNSLIDKFYSIRGRKATITLTDKGILNTMTSLSPYLYETKDTKIADLVKNYKNCMVLDTDGQVYTAGPNGMLNLTNLSNFSLNTFYKMLGPWGKVLGLIGEHIGEEELLDDDYEEENEQTFLEGMELKKF